MKYLDADRSGITLGTLGLCVFLASLSWFILWVITKSGFEAGMPRAQGATGNQKMLAAMANLELRLAKVEKHLASLDNLPEDTKVSSRIAKVQIDLSDVNTRMSALESGILKSPMTALSVPLLRRDLEHFKSEYRRDNDSTIKYIDRVYDQNKWFIGLMFTMAIALLGIAASNFFQARQAQRKKRD